MLHPSYNELINAVNKDVEQGEPPVVQSRYSIVKRRDRWKGLCSGAFGDFAVSLER